MAYCLTRDQVVTTLRAVADRMESDPAMDVGDRWCLAVQAYGLTGEQIAAVAASPGTWHKSVTGTDDSLFELHQEVGDAAIEVHGSRDEVCVARETGRTVTQRRQVTPAVYEEVEVPEVVWDCQPVLARAES